MSLKDFWEKVQIVREKLRVVATCNPTLDMTKAFSYLKNVGDVLMNYKKDYLLGRHQTLAGFREMALFNFGRAEQILSEAIDLTLKPLKDSFFKKAHGRVPAELVKAVLLRADEVLHMEGLAPAKRLLVRADQAFYLEDYDLRLKELSQLAGGVKVPTKTEKSKPASAAEYFKRPLAVKLGKVAHKDATTPTTQPQEPKAFTGRFVDPNASSVPMVDPSAPVQGMTTDLQRNRTSQRQLASRIASRGVAVSGTGKAAIARRKGGKK